MKNILTFEDFVNESYSINEGAVKAFEMGMKNLINNIRRGYGWIDPEYVYDTVSNSSDFDGFNYHDIETEVFKRLIDAGLLYWTNPADPEVKGRKTSLSDLGIKESIDTEVYEGNVEYIGPFVIHDNLSDEELNRMWNDAQDGFYQWQKGFYYSKADYKRAYTTIEKIAKMKKIKLTAESVNEAEQIKIGTFVRYKKDEDFTGGKVISITSGKAEIHNWDGSTIELPIKDLEYVKSWNEANDEFVPATLTEDFEDLRKGDAVKINALEFTSGNDKETIESIRPDGKKMEIKKSILTVKI